MDRKNIKWSGYSFVAPNLILWMLFLAVPVIMTIGFSFTNYDGLFKSDFVGIRNYARFLLDAKFYTVFYNTIFYVILETIFIFYISLFLALLITKTTSRLKELYRAIIYIPVMMAALIVGISWRWLVGDLGFVTYWLEQINIKIHWFTEPGPAWIILLVGKIWASSGYFMVFYCIALENISKEVIEASAIDGANSYRRFWSIIFPLLRPTHFLVITLSILNGFKEYPLVLAMTGGGPANSTTFMVQYIYDEGFIRKHYGYASAISLLLMVFLIIITFINYKFNKGGKEL